MCVSLNAHMYVCLYVCMYVCVCLSFFHSVSMCLCMSCKCDSCPCGHVMVPRFAKSRQVSREQPFDVMGIN